MQTIKKVKVSRTNKTTRGTSLRSHVRIDKINNLTFSFSLVFDKALQLIETPTVHPSIKSLSFYNLTYSFKVFHHNYVSVADNVLANYMVVVPHKTFLPTGQLPKQSPRRFCAFALQPFTQVVELNNLGFGSLKNNSLASYSKIVYSEINTQNPVATRSWSVDPSGKSDVKKQSSFPVLDNLKSLVLPIQIFPVVFWNIYLNILPFEFCESGKPYFLKGESKQVSVEVDWTGLDNWLNFKLGSFKIFRSLCNGFASEVSRKPFSEVFVDKMMKIKSIAYFDFKSFVDSVLNCLLESVGHIKQLFINWNFEFYCGNRFHINKLDGFLYKAYARMSSGYFQYGNDVHYPITLFVF